MLPNLRRLIAREEFFDEFRDFDKLMEATQERLPERTSDAASIAWRLFELTRDHFYMSRVTKLKLREVGHGIVTAADSDNLTLYITLARSLFEHAASLVYQNDLTQKALAQITKKQSPIEMIKEIDSNHDKLKLLYYGSSNSGDKAFVHINDMLDVAAKDREHIRQDYASLCDFTEPDVRASHPALDISEVQRELNRNTCTRITAVIRLSLGGHWARDSCMLTARHS